LCNVFFGSAIHPRAPRASAYLCRMLAFTPNSGRSA
jgi:hypothetical protein